MFTYRSRSTRQLFASRVVLVDQVKWLHIALMCGATLIPIVAAGAQGPDRVTLSGRNIAIYNLVGSLHVTGGGSSTVATITRRGRDAGKLTLATGNVDGSEALRVMYPGDRVTVPDSRNRRSRTEIRVRDNGTFGNNYNHENNGRRRSSSMFSDGRRVQIGSESGGLEAAVDIQLQIPNGVSVRLHLGVGDVDVRGVNGDIAVDVSGANITVVDTKGTLTLDTGSGAATLTNVNGLISLDTGSGNVVAKNITSDGFIIDSGSGDVTVDGCACSKVSIETGSGGLRVSEMTTKSLALDTGSGDVVLGLRNAPDIITIDSGSGNVTLTLPTDFGAVIDIDTGSGGIASDFPITLSSKSRGEMHGRIGRGDGKLSIETGSGSVKLRKAN
ncbi:MAG: DUF4097 family beta strand repeat-containing protein [Gemmatimonadaceae bacterium]